jgi:hypothetical protein
MGARLHTISTPSSLCTVAPSLVKIETSVLLFVLPTLIKDVEKFLKESVLAAFLRKLGEMMFGFPVPLVYSCIVVQDAIRIDQVCLLYLCQYIVYF